MKLYRFHSLGQRLVSGPLPLEGRGSNDYPSMTTRCENTFQTIEVRAVVLPEPPAYETNQYATPYQMFYLCQLRQYIPLYTN